METWFVLVDGVAADPRDVRPGPDGVLRHTDGRAVAYKPHGPRSRMVDPVAERAKVALMAGEMSMNEARAAVDLPPVVDVVDEIKIDHPKPQSRDMKPSSQSGGYRTRDSKAT